MSVLYITDQGATITNMDGRIVVRKENKLFEDLPARFAFILSIILLTLL